MDVRRISSIFVAALVAVAFAALPAAAQDAAYPPPEVGGEVVEQPDDSGDSSEPVVDDDAEVLGQTEEAAGPQVLSDTGDDVTPLLLTGLAVAAVGGGLLYLGTRRSDATG